MLKKFIRKNLFLALLTTVTCIEAQEYVPQVYQDDYILVRSGIEQAGRSPVHLGDRLSLLIDTEFPAGEVAVENLDEQYFIRNWGSEKGITLITTPELTRSQLGGGQTRVQARFDFQILDCPGELISCRGNKLYELPIFTLGYQILDSGGNVLNNKSVRFNPNPGYIVVMQALDVREGPLDDLSAYLGNSGYPSAQGVPDTAGAGTWAILTGSILFLLSFFPVLLRKESVRRVEGTRKAQNRWEKVLAVLQKEGDYSDEEWSDLLRRCATWYSMDVLGINPYELLNDENRYSETSRVAEFREYFVDILNQDGIPPEAHGSYLDRFNKFIDAPAASRSTEAAS
jgi:hypothetical protein